MGTFVVGASILAVVTLIIRKMIRDKKKGKSPMGCDGNCGHCGGSCH